LAIEIVAMSILGCIVAEETAAAAKSLWPQQQPAKKKEGPLP
jgi:hypothetical protein